MIRQAFQQLQNSRSKRARFFFIKGKTKITSCSAQDFDKIYTDFPDRFIGSFNKDISYEDFEVEVQAAINEIFKNDAHIEAIEEKHGQGCGVWVNHSCGFPYLWESDEIPTQKEIKRLQVIAPIDDYGRRLYKPETRSTGLLNG